MTESDDQQHQGASKEERGYQPPAPPPRAVTDPQKVETGYVPPLRPAVKEKKK